MSTCPHLIQQNFIQSVQGRFVWKDECTKCFVNQKSPEGVNLCVYCLNGGCDHHSLLHYKNTSHPLVLNFRSVLKPKDESAPQEKKEITKIAIGKPGGADFSEEEWEMWTQLKCLECNKVLDGSQFKGIIDSIVKAESASIKSSLQAWELEIKPCAHLNTMVQTSHAPLSSEALAHCGECDLSTNLWLCLFCGHLGCGRKNYDGSGGNGHAMQHFNTTGHTIVVKQGTITPDGQASIHCYACDEEVADPNLSNHLKNFGINVEKLEKTEKTMAEMTLWANLNLSLSSVIEEGRVLIPLFGEGFTGLQNLGNSCYMNSILQILFSLDEFKNRYFIEGIQHLEECKKYSPECFMCQIAKVGHGIWSGKYSQKLESKPDEKSPNPQHHHPQFYQEGIRPFMFKHLVGKGHPEFSTDRQQDATEYLKHLFSHIQKAEKAAKLDDITKGCTFKQGSKLVCAECGGFKIREAESNDVRLPLPHSDKKKIVINPSTMKEEEVFVVDFLECVHAMSNEQVIVYCQKCKKDTVFHKINYIKNWPKYLWSVVSRIKYENWVIKKDITEIHFPSETVDLSFLKKPINAPNEFELTDEEEPQVKFDEDALNNLRMMGFGDNRIKRALLANNNNVEASVNWLFERMDDASLDEPLPAPKKASPSGGVHVSEENVQAIIGMGFTDKQARIVLSKTDNNVERAIDYLFSHDVIEEEAPVKESQSQSNDMEIEDPKNPVYELYAAVVHLGSSYGCGHYVAYIKKDGEWVLYNDAKVAKSTEPAIGKGSMYLFRRKD